MGLIGQKFLLSQDAKMWWEVRRLHKWTFKRVLPSEEGEEAKCFWFGQIVWFRHPTTQAVSVDED